MQRFVKDHMDKIQLFINYSRLQQKVSTVAKKINHSKNNHKKSSKELSTIANNCKKNSNYSNNNNNNNKKQ